MITGHTVSLFLTLVSIGDTKVEHISDPGSITGGHDCGLLRAGDKIIDDVPCRQLLRHFFCETKDRNCSQITDASSCITHKMKTYVIYSNSNLVYTWYTAKEQCHKRNMSLASFEKKDSEQIMDKVAFTMGPYEKAWLGLRKMEYMFESSSQEYLDINSFNWAPKSPCPCPDLKCVVVQQDGKWTAENCTARHGFLCLVEAENRGKDQGTKHKHTQASTNVPAAVCLPILAVGLIVFVLFMFRRRIHEKCSALRGKQIEKRQRDDDVNEQPKEEATPLNSTDHYPPPSTQLCSCLGYFFKRKGRALQTLLPLTESAKQLINEYFKDNDILDRIINILLIGLPGAGKSSLINSLMACVQKEGYIDWCQTGNFDIHGQGGRSAITDRLSRFRLFEHMKKKKHPPEELSYMCRPTLWDCPGFMDDASAKTKHVLDLLLRGALTPGTKINDLLQMSDKELEEKKRKLPEDKTRKVDLILLVHAADSTAYPGNLMEALLDRTRNHGSGIPVFFVLNKKDMVSKNQHQQILNVAAAKVGLRGNYKRTAIVSSYAEGTMIKEQNRTPKIDDEMVGLWTKLLDPAFYAEDDIETEPSDEVLVHDENEAKTLTAMIEPVGNTQETKEKLED